MYQLIFSGCIQLCVSSFSIVVASYFYWGLCLIGYGLSNQITKCSVSRFKRYSNYYWFNIYLLTFSVLYMLGKKKGRTKEDEFPQELTMAS